MYNLIYSGNFWTKYLNPHTYLQLSLKQGTTAEWGKKKKKKHWLIKIIKIFLLKYFMVIKQAAQQAAQQNYVKQQK